MDSENQKETSSNEASTKNENAQADQNQGYCTVSASQSKVDKDLSSGPSLKPSVLNPFKITPTNSWPTSDNPETHSKPILAPPKFGSNSSSNESKSFSSVSSPNIATRTQWTTSTPFGTISQSVSDSHKSFKFKPAVLSASVSSTGPSSFPVKRPATSDSCVDENSSNFKKDDLPPKDSSPPDPKRIRPGISNSADSSEIHSPTSPQPQSSESNESTLTTPISEEFNVENSKSKLETESLSLSTSSSSLPPTIAADSSTSTSTSVPRFVPLTARSETPSTEDKVNGLPNASSPPFTVRTTNSGFIFGQNLQSKVSGVASSGVSSSASIFSNGETNNSDGGPVTQRSTPFNLFTAAASHLAGPSFSTDHGKSLSETSRELSLKEESLRAKYDEVEVVTGEEAEKNVIQMNCKLYAWMNGSWQERGRGILRLNDREIRDELHSRLVVRMQGTLTVMLNTKIWSEMSIEKPNDKSVRFTASDSEGQPKIYLVMGTPKDITLLHNSLEYRVAAARSQSLDEEERADVDEDTFPPLSV